MLDAPGLRLRISEAEQFETHGSLADRAAEFARRWADFHGWQTELGCHIDVLSAAPQHVGLGVGTQLGLSVAAGLHAFFGEPQPSPGELALSVARGLRSAVGTYGFVSGGLIVDRGKLPGELIAPLDVRLKLPPAWRFVLLQPPDVSGLSGEAEWDAFTRLPPVPPDVTAELLDEVRLRMLPAAAWAQFEAFGESVYRYGRLAGQCFAAVQGGAYRSPRLAEIVDTVRALGVRGVGQSSWGPTLFAVLPNEADARDFTTRLRQRLGDDAVQTVIAPPNNRGAEVRTVSGPT
jgi:beta-RFAP synthase